MVECCGALCAVAAAVTEELELPTSDDPMRVPQKLHRIPQWSGALAKQALVHYVLEAFTLMPSHYNGIRFDEMASGFPDEYFVEALDAFTVEVQGPAERFANALVPTSDARGNPVDGTSPSQAL